MPEGGHDGAWYCAHRTQFDADGLRNFCPPEGCPKGFCARDDGWQHGDASPDRCTGIVRAEPDLAEALKAILDNTYVGKSGQMPVSRSKWANYPAHLYHKGRAALAKATLPELVADRREGL